MDKWFRSKWFVRGISLALAILLYVFVSYEIAEQTDGENPRIFPSSNPQMETVDNMPVEIRIDTQKFVVSGVPEFVDVQLEGTSSKLIAAARQRNFTVFVDLEGLDIGEHTVELQTENVPSEIKAIIEPEFINIVIEERASNEYPVAVDFINHEELPEGYEVGDVEVNPESVTITSSQNIIDQIGIVKVYVDIGGATEDIQGEYQVNVYDRQGNELRVRIEPQDVSVSIEINNPSKAVSVSVPTIGTLPEGLSLVSIEQDIEELEIFATSDLLEGLDEIATEAVNLSNITESGTMDLELDLPPGVQAPSVDRVRVTIELEQTRVFEELLIDIESLEDGQEVSFIEPEAGTMRITAVGNDQNVKEMTDEDVRIFIDLSGLEEGEHQVPVQVEGPEDISIELEVVEVTIQITEI